MKIEKYQIKKGINNIKLHPQAKIVSIEMICTSPTKMSKGYNPHIICIIPVNYSELFIRKVEVIESNEQFDSGKYVGTYVTSLREYHVIDHG